MELFCQARDTQDGTEILAIKGPLFSLSLQDEEARDDECNTANCAERRNRRSEERRGADRQALSRPWEFTSFQNVLKHALYDNVVPYFIGRGIFSA